MDCPELVVVVVVAAAVVVVVDVAAAVVDVDVAVVVAVAAAAAAAVVGAAAVGAGIDLDGSGMAIGDLNGLCTRLEPRTSAGLTRGCSDLVTAVLGAPMPVSDMAGSDAAWRTDVSW
jgi:hypothetical protein